MKSLLKITLVLLITGCSSTKSNSDRTAEEKFKLCSDIKYNRLITQDGPIEGLPIYKNNIHSLFENYLLTENYLTDISKSGYAVLLEKVSSRELNKNILNKFKSDLGFNPDLLFPVGFQMGCYDYVIDQLKILDNSSWEFDFRDAYWKYEASGDLSTNVKDLINALDKIPADKFSDIAYRKSFIDIIYNSLD